MPKLPWVLAVLAGLLAPWHAVGADLETYRKALAGDDPAVLVALLRADRGQTPTGPQGESLLHMASVRPIGDHRVRMTAALLAAGAAVEARDNSGATPLAWAVGFDCAGCVDLLLKSGAKVMARNNRGATPLHVAGPAIAAKLIAAGADPLAADSEGNRPLHRMYHEALLGVGVNVRNMHGFTPLHFAALKADEEGVRWLLSKGADPTAQSTARYEFQELAPEWRAKPEVIEAGARPYDIALRWHDRSKWSTGRHRMTLEILEQATPRRGLFSR